MSVAQNIEKAVKKVPAGQIFSYQDLAAYKTAPNAVIKAVNRLAAAGQVTRFAKGKFYRPKQGLLGARKPSDNEVIRSILYKNGQLQGYVTGIAAYNKLGLTTQLPRTITVAIEGSRQQKEFGTIAIKTVKAAAPVKQKQVKLLQYLDALRDIKAIPDSDIDLTFNSLAIYIGKLTTVEQKTIASLAQKYYRAQVRALLGLALSNMNLSIADSLRRSLNPTTRYKLSLNKRQWPSAVEWNID